MRSTVWVLSGSCPAFVFFFFQAEDGIRDLTVTGVQTCARPISAVLVVEPIAKRDKEWWPEWAERLTAAGARADEWRFPAALPAGLRQIARSANLNPRELTSRTRRPGNLLRDKHQPAARAVLLRQP